jgi:hypothetical protein
MPDEPRIRSTPTDYGQPYAEPQQTSAGYPAPGSQPQRRDRRPDQRGLVAGGLALLATLAVAALGGGGYLAYMKVTAASTFIARGSILLHSSDPLVDAYRFDGTACSGSGGYGDIAGGQTVVVRDAAGTTVATATLNGGSREDDGCHFEFAVKVPDGSKFYSFEVSHRGPVTLSRAEAERPKLTLGH